MVSWAELRGVLLALGGVLMVVVAIITVQPGLPGELVLQSLRFHAVAAGLAVAALLIILRARIRGGLLLLVMLAAGLHGASYIAEYEARRVAYAEAPMASFRFLSFNVLNRNPQSQALVDAILADPPDVMLVMETPGIEEQLDRLATVLPYRIGCEVPSGCDISLHSRFPLEDARMHRLAPLNTNRLVTASFAVDGNRVTVAGVHFSKPYHDNATPYEFWLVNRMLSGIEGPLVVAGDFNAALWSDSVATLGRNNELKPGSWPPATWPVRLGWLGIPIDNVFTRGSAQLISLEAGRNFGSNHAPLWAEVGLYAPD